MKYTDEETYDLPNMCLCYVTCFMRRTTKNFKRKIPSGRKPNYDKMYWMRFCVMFAVNKTDKYDDVYF
jgi:hypothetical protein